MVDNSLINKSIDNSSTTVKTSKEDRSINESQMNSISENAVDIFNFQKKNFDNNNDKDINYLQNQVKKLQKLLLGEQGNSLRFW